MTDEYRPTYIDSDGRYFVRGEQVTKPEYEEAIRRDGEAASELIGKIERKEPLTDEEIRRVTPEEPSES